MIMDEPGAPDTESAATRSVATAQLAKRARAKLAGQAGSILSHLELAIPRAGDLVRPFAVLLRLIPTPFGKRMDASGSASALEHTTARIAVALRAGLLVVGGAMAVVSIASSRWVVTAVLAYG